MCLGIIGMVPVSNIEINGGNASFSLISTVLSLTARIDAMYLLMTARVRTCTSRSILSIENTTSAEVNGLPSCHFTPFCSSKV
ncbi:hypothetical protein D9M68_619620 [compost metagenome]